MSLSLATWKRVGVTSPAEGAVLVTLHLHGVDLHDGEEPLFLDVEVERRFIAGVAVFVVLEPLEKIVGAAGFDDLVIQGADDAGFEDFDLWLALAGFL
jgi:hypothetical protein